MMETFASKWLLPVLLSAIAFLAPIHVLMASVGFLIFVDLVTGILAAKKRGEAITSRAMSRTIYKVVCYQLAVISGIVLEGLIPGGLSIAKLCAGAVALVEFKSFLENVQTLTGVDLLTSVLAKVQKREGDGQ